MPELQAFANGASTLDISVGPVARGEVIIAASGELDCDSAGHLRIAITELLNRGDVSMIGLDLRGIEVMDSTGLGTLVAARRICRSLGVRLRLVAAGPFVERLLGVSAVGRTLAPAARPAIDETPALAS